LLVAEGLGQLRVGAAAGAGELDEHPRSIANEKMYANTQKLHNCHYSTNSSKTCKCLIYLETDARKWPLRASKCRTRGRSDEYFRDD
jgi:hypothetical protein